MKISCQKIVENGPRSFYEQTFAIEKHDGTIPCLYG